MINRIRPLSAAVLLLCAGFSTSALATTRCASARRIDAEQIKRTGGFSTAAAHRA